MAEGRIPMSGSVNVYKRSYNYGQAQLIKWGNEIVNDADIPVEKPVIISIDDNGKHVLLGSIHASRLYASFILIDYFSPIQKYTMWNGTDTVKTYQTVT